MAKRCGSLTDEQRRNVGEGVRRAWQRRHEKNGGPVSDKGKLSQIAHVLRCTPEDAVKMVKWLNDQHIEICSALQECVQRHKLGLGGERVDRLVIAELDRLKGN